MTHKLDDAGAGRQKQHRQDLAPRRHAAPEPAVTFGEGRRGGTPGKDTLAPTFAGEPVAICAACLRQVLVGVVELRGTLPVLEAALRDRRALAPDVVKRVRLVLQTGDQMMRVARELKGVTISPVINVLWDRAVREREVVRPRVLALLAVQDRLLGKGGSSAAAPSGADRRWVQAADRLADLTLRGDSSAANPHVAAATAARADAASSDDLRRAYAPLAPAAPGVALPSARGQAPASGTATPTSAAATPATAGEAAHPAPPAPAILPRSASREDRKLVRRYKVLGERLLQPMAPVERARLQAERDRLEWKISQRGLDEGRGIGVGKRVAGPRDAEGATLGTATDLLTIRTLVEAAISQVGSVKRGVSVALYKASLRHDKLPMVRAVTDSIERDAAAFAPTFQRAVRANAEKLTSQGVANLRAQLGRYDVDAMLVNTVQEMVTDSGWRDDPAQLEALVQRVAGRQQVGSAAKKDRDDLVATVAPIMQLLVQVRAAEAELKGPSDVVVAAERGTRADRLRRSAELPAPAPTARTPMERVRQQTPSGTQVAATELAIHSRRVHTLRAQLFVAWQRAEAAHPILVGYRHALDGDAQALGPLVHQPEVGVVRAALPRLGNLAITQTRLRDGSLDPLKLDRVVALTRQAMRIPPGSVRDAAANDLVGAAASSSWVRIALEAFTTLASLLPQGRGPAMGLRSMLALAGTGVSIGLAGRALADYQLMSVAGATALDKAHALSSANPTLGKLFTQMVADEVADSVITSVLQQAAKLGRLARRGAAPPELVATLNSRGARHGMPHLGDELVEAEGLARGTRHQPTAQYDAELPAGEGVTDKWGNIRVSPHGTTRDKLRALIHERVHSMLTPRTLNRFRGFRAELAMVGYERVALLQYIEEALAETITQVKLEGLSVQAVLTGLRFPIRNGYVTLGQVVGQGSIGTITYAGIVYAVYVTTEEAVKP
ncbi:MAG: hypothetical protein KA297_28475 [Kofleriaceae bacterium]|nr:hypothetical protein [Kofleriaceae bacterium]MBP6840320.1 hypothetical protein [Kofleriaceae bacterium]